jgi:hypothetical protein
MNTDYCDNTFQVSSTSEQYDEFAPVTLQYDKSVHTKFKTLIVFVLFLAVISPFTFLWGTGWSSILFASAVVLAIYYLKRIKRVIRLSDKGVYEKSFWRERYWTYAEIADIVDMIANHPTSDPSRRVNLEHVSTHDISIDDQMDGFNDALSLVQKFWVESLSKRMNRKHVQFFVLKYW